MCSRRLTNPSMGSLPGSSIQRETRSSYGSRLPVHENAPTLPATVCCLARTFGSVHVPSTARGEVAGHSHRPSATLMTATTRRAVRTVKRRKENSTPCSAPGSVARSVGVSSHPAGALFAVLKPSEEERQAIEEYIDDSVEPLRGVMDRWEEALNRKGRVPYIEYPNVCARCGRCGPSSSGFRTRVGAVHSDQYARPGDLSAVLRRHPAAH